MQIKTIKYNDGKTYDRYKSTDYKQLFKRVDEETLPARTKFLEFFNKMKNDKEGGLHYEYFKRVFTKRNDATFPIKLVSKDFVKFVLFYARALGFSAGVRKNKDKYTFRLSGFLPDQIVPNTLLNFFGSDELCVKYTNYEFNHTVEIVMYTAGKFCDGFEYFNQAKEIRLLCFLLALGTDIPYEGVKRSYYNLEINKYYFHNPLVIDNEI